jgi:succinate dehydrogenase flavin-adding protein (antitoxin of CptAB toxin-antitoxin module)
MDTQIINLVAKIIYRMLNECLQQGDVTKAIYSELNEHLQQANNVKYINFINSFEAILDTLTAEFYNKNNKKLNLFIDILECYDNEIFSWYEPNPLDRKASKDLFDNRKLEEHLQNLKNKIEQYIKAPEIRSLIPDGFEPYI